MIKATELGWGPEEPAARAHKKYGDAVDVRVFDSIRGVETRLSVPMWFGDQTKYLVTHDPEWKKLSEAIDDGSVIWWGGPGADIEYHFENGYFVLDSIVVRPTR